MGRKARRKIWFMVLDKAVLGLGVVIVTLVIQHSWNKREQELMEKQHAEALELKRVELAARLVPHMEDAEAKPYLLHILVGSDSLPPELVAEMVSGLIAVGVSPDQLLRAAGRSMRSDIRPFLDKAKEAVTRYRLERDKHWETYLAWRKIFGGMLEIASESDRVFVQLSDGDDALNEEAGRFHTLAWLIGRDELGTALQQIQSPMAAVQRVGHMAVVVKKWVGYFDESEKFVMEMIREPRVSEEDFVRLSDELRVLSDSVELFGSMLMGDIAIPVGEVFAESENLWLQYMARDVLLSMIDCGVKADEVLSRYVEGVKEELIGIEDTGARFVQTSLMGQEIALVGDIGTGMGSDMLTEALSSLNELGVVRHSHPGLLEGRSCQERHFARTEE